MAKIAYSAQEKYELIVAFENRQTSIQEFCQENNISKKTMKEWIYLFQRYGLDGLQGSSGWKRYSKEIKMAAVLDYLSGNYSQTEIIHKYEISSRSVLRKWITNYNHHRDLKEMKRMRNSMRKGRSTMREERLEIVLYCLENGKNYGQTSEYFHHKLCIRYIQ